MEESMRLISLITAAVVLTATGARAGTIYLSLTQAYAYANPGDTVAFDATVSADWYNDDAVYLNSDSVNVDSPLLLNDSPFFADFPAYMYPGDSTTATLFTVFVPLGTSSGIYTGYFEIDGGADGLAGEFLASSPFNVEVGSTDSSTPEPSSLVLTGAALLALSWAGGRLRALRS
jgi:hypothetical protein